MGKAGGLKRSFILIALMIVPVDWLVAEELLDIVPVSQHQLAEASGRQGLPVQWQVNDTEQNATLSNNSLSGQVVTGDNTIAGNAFEHMNGVATVIQNTGNQVVIQESTQINVLINR
ncbi:hypothetical protein [Marinobacter caseinilyticus]|uniref:hypothetical protein n=1 Tax=Marinobacter caseinilyticus TaxID=2692195 RepID=UPI00140D58B6|nr:hypothetical protein [Marinobacter caseinilyticus]